MKKYIMSLSLLGCAVLPPVEINAQDDKRPNFIVFIADDLGWEDIAPYGHPVIKTPNIDRIAAQGCRFDKVFLTASSSSPSRSSIMTAMYPHSTDAEILHKPLPETAEVVATPLRGAGYFTASVGKWHLGPNVKKQFDLVQDYGGNRRNKMGNDWVAMIANCPKDKPFFIWAGSNDPHRPYNDIKEVVYTPDDVIIPAYFPDTPGMRQDLADYYNSIARFDKHVGMALDELERQGLMDNTVIMVMTDNGRPFPQCKTRTNQQGMRTPLIIRYPGTVKKGSTSNALISSIDIMPTILDIAGTSYSKEVDGISFRQILSDPEASFRKYAFAEHNWHNFMAYERAIYSERYIYSMNYLPDLPATPPLDALRGAGYQSMILLWKENKLKPEHSDCFIVPRPGEELFDYLSDKDCMNNLVSERKFHKVHNELKKQLKKHAQKTSDKFPGRDKIRQEDLDRTTGEKLDK
ncbi:sulfatase [Proteiniphilum sp.]|uniref:sulfatase family protein n=1 Tax=Proteiniphilum sp. TaxID=1926877 RepID=UPI002B20699C|nr:sulfatase [Proteiniphilum sp.]MEA4916152.1 sulfatase [Proteiniphilum sp.]